ncbi:ArsR/SmtB family transcription factor [Streptomyces mayteni]
MGEEAATGPRLRQDATVREAKALAHPLRARILRLCGQREMTNKQLADRLQRDPGTVLYHVRQLTEAGFLEPAPVRTGGSGALEKPYRSTGRSWWLNYPLAKADAEDARLVPLLAFQEELRESGPESIAEMARFMLHLSPEELAEFNTRLVALLDEYIVSDDTRREGRPAYGGFFLLHRLVD